MGESCYLARIELFALFLPHFAPLCVTLNFTFASPQMPFKAKEGKLKLEVNRIKWSRVGESLFFRRIFGRVSSFLEGYRVVKV